MKQALSAGLFLFCLVGRTIAQTVDTDLAEWLEEDARAYAQSTQARGTPADARIVLAIMREASQLAPRLAGPYRGQYEMAEALGDTARAEDALGKYTTLRAHDLTRRLRWIEMKLATFQTAEERLEFLRDKMMTTEGALVRSDINRHIAQTLYAQGDVDKADQEIRESLRLYPGNEAARQLSDQFHERIPPEQVAAMHWLRMAGANPADWQTCLSLARELDCLGLRTQASTWFEHARKILDRDGADTMVLAELLLESARSAKSDGRLDQATVLCDQAIELAPDASAPRVLRVHLCRAQGDEQPCAEILEWLRSYHERLAQAFGESPDPMTAAALSWFYGRVEGAHDKAVFYADQALEISPDHPVAQGCAGSAYLDAGNAQRAIELLTPLASNDPLAAAALGRALYEQGRPEDGVHLLRALIAHCASGQPYDTARAFLESRKEPIPKMPQPATVQSALSRFQTGRRDYTFDPDKYLVYRVDLARPLKDTLSNWELRFAVLNRGDFDITVGEGMMLDPRFVVSFELHGEVFAQFPDYMTVFADERPVLRPGQFTETNHTIDTGPLRDFLWRTIQADYDVRVRILADPRLSEQGHWIPAPWAPSEYEFSFRREGFVATQDNVTRLIEASQSLDPRARVPATQKLIALWAEHQANISAPQRYTHRILEPDELESIAQAVLQRATEDQNPGVRVRILGALRVVHLHKEHIAKLSASLSHEDALIRLETVLLLADQQGPAFLPVARSLAVRDPSPVVRDVCAGLRDNWTAPTPSSP